jgi:hypothetical protein
LDLLRRLQRDRVVSYLLLSDVVDLDQLVLGSQIFFEQFIHLLDDLAEKRLLFVNSTSHGHFWGGQ